MEEERPLSTVQAARILGVSRSTVQRWCEEGRFPHAELVGKIEGQRGLWVIPSGDLERLQRPKMGRPPKQEK